MGHERRARQQGTALAAALLPAAGLPVSVIGMGRSGERESQAADASGIPIGQLPVADAGQAFEREALVTLRTLCKRYFAGVDAVAFQRALRDEWPDAEPTASDR